MWKRPVWGRQESPTSGIHTTYPTAVIFSFTWGAPEQKGVSLGWLDSKDVRRLFDANSTAVFALPMADSFSNAHQRPSRGQARHEPERSSQHGRQGDPVSPSSAARPRAAAVRRRPSGPARAHPPQSGAFRRARHNSPFCCALRLARLRRRVNPRNVDTGASGSSVTEGDCQLLFQWTCSQNTTLSVILHRESSRPHGFPLPSASASAATVDDGPASTRRSRCHAPLAPRFTRRSTCP